MNIDDVSTQLLYTTVPILIQESENIVSSATGFIFSIVKEQNLSIPLLITNYHVIKNVESGCFDIHLSNNGTPTDETVRISFNKEMILTYKLGELDLVAIPLANTFDNLVNNRMPIFFRSINQNNIPTNDVIEDFSAVEDVCFIGYPSGLYDHINKLPVIRQGITATPIWNNFNGNHQFLIDAGVFPGSSGSPVFIYNRGTYPTKNGITVGTRLYFVGIISQTLSRKEKNTDTYLNLGVVISSNAMYEELKKLMDRLGVNN